MQLLYQGWWDAVHLSHYSERSGLQKQDLNGLSIKFAYLDLADFSHSSLKRSQFSYVVLRQVRFNQCNLESAMFDNCDLSNTSWVRAILTGAIFTNCRFTGVNQKALKAGGARIRGTDYHAPPRGVDEE